MVCPFSITFQHVIISAFMILSYRYKISGHYQGGLCEDHVAEGDRARIWNKVGFS